MSKLTIIVPIQNLFTLSKIYTLKLRAMYEKPRRCIRQASAIKEVGFLKLGAFPEVLDPGVRERLAIAKTYVHEFREIRQMLCREICISCVARKVHFLKVREPQQVGAISDIRAEGKIDAREVLALRYVFQCAGSQSIEMAKLRFF